MDPGDGGQFFCTTLRWTAEDLAKRTPSRKSDIVEKEEQTGRFHACNYARNIVRTLYNDNSTQPQILACYYIQIFYMFRSLRHEDWKVVAVSAAFLACKVVDLPRRMRGLLRAWNQYRVQNGEPELGEDEQRRVTERILKIEFLLLRILRFDFDVQLPTEFLEPLAGNLLVRLSQHDAFRNACTAAGKVAVQEANNLKKEILQTAERFTMDCFMGVAPLIAPPRVVAAGAVVLTTKYLRREMQMPDLISMMHAYDEALKEVDVRNVIEEIMNVFKTKAMVEKQQKAGQGGAAAAPAAVPAAKATMHSSGGTAPASMTPAASAAAAAKASVAGNAGAVQQADAGPRAHASGGLHTASSAPPAVPSNTATVASESRPPGQEKLVEARAGPPGGASQSGVEPASSVATNRSSRRSQPYGDVASSTLPG